MIIRKIRLENFKRFELLEVELKNLDCLVGTNNSGKSTLLQALALFDFCVHECLSRKSSNGNGEVYPIEIKNRSVAPEDFIVLPVTQPTDLWHDKTTQRNRQRVIIRITVTFDNEKSATATVDLNYNRFGLSLETDNNQEWLNQLALFKISYLPVFSAFSPQEQRFTPVIISDALATGKVNNVVRNILLNLQQKEKIAALENLLNRAFPTMKNLRIQFNELTDRYIEVTYKEEGRKKEFDIFAAGSGFQQFLYLFGYTMLQNPNILLLDEPDVHLHGALQGSLLHELQRLVEDGKQVVFATHSKDLITKVYPENILHLSDSEPRRLKVNFDIYDTLEELGSIDNIQIAQIQAFKRLLIVEDISDWKLLQAFGNIVLGEKEWQKVVKRIAVCPAKGNPAKQNIVRFREQVSKMLSLSGSPLKILVIADRDYHPELENLRVEKTAEHQYIRWNIWYRSEIENYLLSPEVMARTAGISHETLLYQPLRDEFNNLVDASKRQVRDKFLQAVQEWQQSKRLGWDVVKVSHKASELTDENWETEKLNRTDAKEVVLPGIKRWLQDNHFSQFSDLKLAENFTPEEVHPEMKEAVQLIAEFTGA